MTTCVSPAERLVALLLALILALSAKPDALTATPGPEPFAGLEVRVTSQAELDALALHEDAEKITSVAGEGADISDIGALCGLTNLTWLNLKRNNNLTRTQVDDLQAKLPNCEISF